jgi:hypothetical protein
MHLLSDQCFYCEKSDKVIEYAVEFPCGDCVVICDQCSDDVLPICDCDECVESQELIVRYHFASSVDRWIVLPNDSSDEF